MTPPPSRNSFAFVVVGELPDALAALPPAEAQAAAQRLVAMFSVNAEVIPHCRASFLRSCPGVAVPELVQKITSAVSPLALA